MCQHTKCNTTHCHGCEKTLPPARDPARGTGRTTNAVKAAVMAAAFGKRVVYLCGNQNSADHASSVAREFVSESLGKVCDQRVSMSKERITFYFANGAVAGILVFRSIAARDINIGMRDDSRFHVIEDHYATEVKAEQAYRAERIEAGRTIRELMQRYGFTRAEILNRCHTRESTIEFS
ncbi:hypothetical protein FDH02_gp04 [Pseudomonas phage VSW-3]|uniref:Uncharacterized protein n=1 Tax=Pseudomonas phage VSW-3 TaxID=1852562 RepID=A0A173GCS9_9CAUD|nr:hypothetical protein FDH02_gp04 [Pseudomonas phage VSW-3]ANH51080.1 hypothetical protein VSW3_4 [Pseudomonas phage VSW-3]